jgi:hypothetical protein
LARNTAKPADRAVREGRLRRLAPVLLTVVLVAGCGGSSHAKSGHDTATVTLTRETTTAGSPAPSKQALAQEYLRIAKPLNRIGHTFVTKAMKWGGKTTNAQAARDAAPLIAAYRRADRQLLRINWPVPLDRHVQALVRANNLLIKDLLSLRTVNLREPSTWQNKFVHEASLAAIAVNIVRADLGLSSQ